VVHFTPTSAAARDAAWPVVFALLLLAYWMTWSTVLITDSKAHVAGLLEAAGAAVFLALSATVVHRHASVSAAANAFLAGQVVLFVGGTIAGLRAVGRPQVPAAAAHYAAMLRRAAPFLLIWLSSSLYFKVDSMLLYYMRGDEETGLYAAAYRLLDAFLAVAVVVGSTSLPRLTRGWTDGLADFRREWKRGFRMLSWMTVLPSIALVVAPGLVIEALFGHRFAGSASALRILGPATAALCIGSYYGYGLTAVGKEWTQLRITLVSLAANVALNLVAIPIAGGQGAAFATLLAGLVYWGLAHRALRMPGAAEPVPGGVADESVPAVYGR
jgi:O-antigen/teichoic acid export membrane protein